MKYKLLKDLPGYEKGFVFIDVSNSICSDTYYQTYVSPSYAKFHPDFFEPIVGKKMYDDLKEGDTLFYIRYDGIVQKDVFDGDDSRSGTFLTHEEAEDEHKRREWAVRKDKLIPTYGETIYYYNGDEIESNMCCGDFYEAIFINNGLLFKTHEECEKAIKEHDLIRLFYTIR